MLQTKVQNYNNIFFKKKLLSKDFFEWHSYKWGYGRPMIERKNYDSEKFFHRKLSSWEKLWLVWYELSLWVHTNDDGNKKDAWELIFFLRKVFHKNMFWITLLIVKEEKTKVK